MLPRGYRAGGILDMDKVIFSGVRTRSVTDINPFWASDSLPCTPSLEKIWDKWNFTVLVLIDKLAATSLFEAPVVIRSITCLSRVVSLDKMLE